MASFPSSGTAAGRRRVLAPGEGEIGGTEGTVRDRFMIEAALSGGGFALVEHLMPPLTLAAPLHRHSREDEYSYVLEGRVGGIFDGIEVFAETGALLFKPRGEWHTFWNAGETPARILEIISPGGFEQAFRAMHAYGEEMSPEQMIEIATQYGVEVDFENTMPVIERHRLHFI
jgi:mannose-6-phosphate isomerase-like protein (cupin superfamily)